MSMESGSKVVLPTGSDNISFFNEPIIDRRSDKRRNEDLKKEFIEKSNYGLWKRPGILLDVVKMYVNGVTKDNLIDYINKKYGTSYSHDQYFNMMGDEDFKNKVKEYREKLDNRVTEAVVKAESEEITKTIINSKDVLRSAIFKMGSLLNKIDDTDETDSELIRNRKLKYGDFSRVMRELRDTIRLLNELEGTGETITIEDIMRKFKRNSEGELIREDTVND